MFSLIPVTTNCCFHQLRMSPLYFQRELVLSHRVRYVFTVAQTRETKTKTLETAFHIFVPLEPPQLLVHACNERGIQWFAIQQLHHQMPLNPTHCTFIQQQVLLCHQYLREWAHFISHVCLSFLPHFLHMCIRGRGQGVRKEGRED